MKNLKEIIDKLLMSAFFISYPRKPGELLKHLSKEEIEILKILQSEICQQSP